MPTFESPWTLNSRGSSRGTAQPQERLIGSSRGSAVTAHQATPPDIRWIPRPDGKVPRGGWKSRVGRKTGVLFVGADKKTRESLWSDVICNCFLWGVFWG